MQIGRCHLRDQATLKLQRPLRICDRFADAGHVEGDLRVVTVDIDRVEPAFPQAPLHGGRPTDELQHRVGC